MNVHTRRLRELLAVMRDPDVDRFIAYSVKDGKVIGAINGHKFSIPWKAAKPEFARAIIARYGVPCSECGHRRRPKSSGELTRWVKKLDVEFHKNGAISIVNK